ncbi:MAG: hypothetical protein CJBNEKGG_00075 [Prosthecobacter sp.]|nr:hypothetical protein [Prosthecobacter sp.]
MKARSLVAAIPAAFLLAAVLAACAFTRAGYESAPFKTVLKEGGFELREYPDLPLVSTEMNGDDASFMRLFGYISGGNLEKQKVAMTTPVIMKQGRMAFVLPSKAAVRAPAPASDKVKLERLQAATVAVLRFSGRRSVKSEQEALGRLRAKLKDRGIQEAGAPFMAYYDPPWVPGFLRRNEVLVPVVKSTGGLSATRAAGDAKAPADES